MATACLFCARSNGWPDVTQKSLVLDAGLCHAFGASFWCHGRVTFWVHFGLRIRWTNFRHRLYVTEKCPPKCHSKINQFSATGVRPVGAHRGRALALGFTHWSAAGAVAAAAVVAPVVAAVAPSAAAAAATAIAAFFVVVVFVVVVVVEVVKFVVIVVVEANLKANGRMEPKSDSLMKGINKENEGWGPGRVPCRHGNEGK